MLPVSRQAVTSNVTASLLANGVAHLSSYARGMGAGGLPRASGTYPAAAQRTTLGPSDLVRKATIARRYYLEGRSKIELAQEFGLSRFKIARILDEAVQQGIVHISISLPAEIDSELSESLRRRYARRRAVVVGTADEPTT